MNELHRQIYLSALGVDTYMPRMHLPYAPVSIMCELPLASTEPESIAKADLHIESIVSSVQPQLQAKAIVADVSPVGSLIGNIFDAPKAVKVIAQPITAADILAQLDTKPLTIEPFSLSIWRPIDWVMIIDSRNTKLALPTEILLNNVLRSLFSNQALKPQEEVLRWPMIENSFTKRTAADARVELQTWLSVQHEIRPIRYLLLMGPNAATYLLPETAMYSDSVYKAVPLVDVAVTALILPSLNELLQKPATKKYFYAALSAYLALQK